MRRIAAIVLVCALCALCLPACGQNPQTLRLGVNLELSGRLAWYGKATLNGILLAAEEVNRDGGVNGKPLELPLLDNRSENAEAALACIKLTTRGRVLAVVGPSTSGGVKASLASSCGVPILVPSATADDLAPENAKTNDMFRLCYTDTMQGGAMAEFAVKKGFLRTAILTEISSDYSRGMSQAFAETFVSLGGTVTGQEYYASGETDFCSVLAKLDAKPFDALFLPAYYTEAALVIRQMNELGIEAAILSGDAFDSPALDELAGDRTYLSDIYYSNHYAPHDASNAAFAESYRAAYAEEPPAYAALGYDCVKLFAQAAKEAKEETPEALARRLAATDGFNGITGLITMNENHNAQKPVHIVSIQNGVRGAADEQAKPDP